ncbi:hypothetical protein V491_00626 [Pseudogymnoascus sp. VKM F-3775]|nr:hypothetical protein V491_00626 [Pseudogymnoascus sp. VKM F-3775]
MMSPTIPQYNDLSEDRLPPNPGFVNKIQTVKPRNEAFYVRNFTSFEAYTTSLVLGDEGKYTEDSKNRNKDEEIRTDVLGLSDSTGSRWTKVQCLPVEIIRTIHELNANDCSFDDKTASLSQVEREHITDLVLNKNWHEHERRYFEWKLVQFRYEQPRNPNAERNGASPMTIYLARAPKPGVDLTWYRNAERDSEEQKRLLHEAERAQARARARAREQFKIMQQQEQMGNRQHVDQGKQSSFVVDKPTVPTAYGNEGRIGSMSPESAYDSYQQNRQNVALSSNWARTEQLEFSTLVHRHGTDWHGIAASMGTKTHIMVKDYYQRQVDSGRFYLVHIARSADKRRRQKEAAAPQSRQNMSQKQPQFQISIQQQQSQRPQKTQQQQPSAKYPKLKAKYGFTDQEQAMIVEEINRFIATVPEEEKNEIRMKISNIDQALLLHHQAQGMDPLLTYCYDRVVPRLPEYKRGLANQKLSQGIQTNMPKSTVPMKQQRSRNPNDGETEEPQQALGNADFGFQDRGNLRHQNLNPFHPFQGTSQPGFPLNAQQAWSGDEYWATKARKQNSEDVDSEGEKMLGGVKAIYTVLSTPSSNVNEASSIKPIPLTEAEYGLRGLEDSVREDFGLDYNELVKSEPSLSHSIFNYKEMPSSPFSQALQELQELQEPAKSERNLPSTIFNYEETPSSPFSQALQELQEPDEDRFDAPNSRFLKGPDENEFDFTSRFLQELDGEYSLQESKLAGRAKLDWNGHISAVDEVTGEGPCTDSGYASILKADVCKNDPPFPVSQQFRVDDKLNVKMGDEDTEDSKTIYSAATSIDLPQSQQYITELCGDIFNKLENHFNSRNWDTLEIALPSLIKAFAIKIGYDSSAQINQQIMYFIHKQHKRIISRLKVMFCHEDDGQPNSPRHGPKGMSLGDKMSMWDSKSGENDTVTESDELFKGVRDEDDEITNEVDLSIYHGIILKSPSYEWLLSSLKKECFLQWGLRQPRIMVDNIRQNVLDKLPTRTISKRRPNRGCGVKFIIQQNDDTEGGNRLLWKSISETLLSELITVTGCQEESQALTVKQYLHQTWPTCGLQLLSALQKAITYSNHDYTVVLPDNTQLKVSVRGSLYIIITVFGPAQFIAECAEQIAWLQAALHTNLKHSAGYCTPSIINYRFDTAFTPLVERDCIGHCEVVAQTAPLASPADGTLQKQSWWQDLVGKRAIIQGFPISRRPEAYPGLELSFELLLSFVQTNEALIDDGIVLLMGSRSTLQLLKDTNDIFLWIPFHPTNGICSCGEQHVEIRISIPYSSIDLRRLETGRHILGVCKDLLTTMAENPEGMCEKSGLSEVKYAQHHASKDVGPSKNLRNTAHNLNAISLSETPSASPKSQDDEKDSRPSFSSQVNYSASRNCQPFHTGDQNAQSLLNDQAQLAADSPSNSTVPSQDESLDSDLLSISDASEQFEMPENNAAVKAFIDDVVNKLVLGFRNTTQCQFTPGANGDSGESAAQAPVPATGSSTTLGNLGRSRKKRRAADDGGGDDAGKDKPPPKRARHIPDQGPQRSFACPYLKMDPVKYSKCCTKQLSRIRDVKQHLNRHHTPKIYCQRCLETNFCNEEALNEHIDRESCRRNDPAALEGISLGQRGQLSRKSNHKISEEDQWFVIWEILFLRRARPRSAYMDTALSTELRLFREYFDTHVESVMGGQYESTLIWPGLESTAEQRLAFLRTIMVHGATRVFEDYPRSLDLERNRNAVYPEHHGDGTHQAQSEPPLSSTGDSGIAVDSQFSPQDANYRRYTPSQLPTTFDNGMPNAWMPVDRMVQMTQDNEDDTGLGDSVGLGDNILDLPNDFFGLKGFDDAGLNFDYLNQP